MYKTAAMPAEQSRESTGKNLALVPLSRYEQALFRRDMSQQFGYLFSRRGRSHEDADILLHSSECDECTRQVSGGVRCRTGERSRPQRARA